MHDYNRGGSHIILKYAGRDATKAFEPIHPNDVLQRYIPAELNLGPVEESNTSRNSTSDTIQPTKKRDGRNTSPKPKLRSIINMRDFERAASQLLPARSFAFFQGGAEDEQTIEWNRDSWKKIHFRPRVLRPIPSVDLTTSIFGTKYSAPFFICPAGGGKLAHPTGEVLLTEAAGKHDILHWVCNNAGCTQREMADARSPAQTLFWQIYAVEDLSITEKEIKQAVALGYKGFALTVDAIRAGKRERDLRLRLEEEDETDGEDDDDDGFASGPTVKRSDLQIASHLFTDLDFPTAVKWLREITHLPIAIKGIQCWEDAALCMKYGVHPWLSNHGGRQLEGAPSAVDTLLAIRHHCPEVLNRCEVIVDGGVTRGTDIVKALALGAKAVGLGRGFLYALALGDKGVSKAIRILKHEVETTMALLGVTSVDQLDGSYVRWRACDGLPRSNL
ncbi:Cytochrome b5 domain-containing protein 1 [Aspergillus nanangensis]|uniref:Cytochrome b5 domain-containing protein 1 n=1 Tax=Aspergillus nanangensis TaxID=2582783 RepID=A0AAD4GY16_ASPNN|nr:Cytochrome b5 domain-containing protein 1 [Aspergillus nanangensis]